MENAKEMKGYKKAEGGNVVKLEKEGDKVAGILLGWEESKMYQGSYAVSIKTDKEIVIVFTSEIPVDMFKKNNLTGKDIVLVYDGKVKTKDGKFEYKNYSVFFKD